MKFIFIFIIMIAWSNHSFSQKQFQTDNFKTNLGELKITFIGHASLMLEYNKKIIYIDPVMKEADYSKVPPADIILITHHHSDHLDPVAIEHINEDKTLILATETTNKQFSEAEILNNGESRTVQGIKIEAVPAYNIVHKRQTGSPYHVKGEGNGYILTFDNVRVYIAGDTENIPEMKLFKNIDIAILPMNLPYTMTPQMVAEAAKMINPKILYPYHYGATDVNELIKLLENDKTIEIRIRDMK